MTPTRRAGVGVTSLTFIRLQQARRLTARNTLTGKFQQAKTGSTMRIIVNSRNINSKRKSTRKRAFDVQAFLDSGGVARRVVGYGRSEKIYSQGDPATSVMYVQKGGVKLSVVNEVGKEAVVAILGPGDFFGEGAMAGQSVRMGQRPRLHPRLYSLLKKTR